MDPCQNFPMYQTVSADYSKPGEPPPELVLLLKRHDAELSYFLPQCSIFVVKMCKSCKSVLARFFPVNQAYNQPGQSRFPGQATFNELWTTESKSKLLDILSRANDKLWWPASHQTDPDNSDYPDVLKIFWLFARFVLSFFPMFP